MTQPSSPTTPFVAPPPAASPTDPADPTQEDRLLAAAAYLGYFTGFWLIVPIVVYVVRREKSRFVAHHAIRALLLHLVVVPLSMLCLVLTLAGGVIAMTVAGGGARGHARGDVVGGIYLLLIWGSWILPFFIYLVVTVLAAIRAFQGRVHKTSLLGRLTEWFLKQDKTVLAEPT